MAAVVAVTVAGTVLIARESSPGPLPLWTGLLLLTATSLPLLARRTAPAATVAAVVLGALLYQALDFPGGAATVPPAIALFSAMAAGRRRAALAGGVAWPAGTLLLGWFGLRPPGLQGAVWFLLWVAATLVLGEMSRNRREQLAAERERVAQVQRAQQEEARRRVTEERLRIARELHDVLAHSVSVVNLRAGVAEHLIDRDPEQARAALGDIRKVTKEALVELRGLLGVLRAVDGDGNADGDVGGGMDRLPELVRRAANGGLDVVLTLPDDHRELPRSVDLAVYRIVQEALTNIIKHAGAARAQVTVRRDGGDLLIEVRDDGAGPPQGGPPREGNGLVGMRERAVSLGGAFGVGPGPDGGFEVWARLPVRSVAL